MEISFASYWNLKNRFKVSRAALNKRCSVCNNEIFYNELVLVENKIKILHLNCSNQEFICPVLKYDIDIDSSLKSQINLEEWLDSWNNKFIKSHNYKVKSSIVNPIKMISINNKRIYIEIFKFLSFKKVTRLASVCKKFYQISMEPEIWQFFLRCDYSYEKIVSNPREKLIKMFFRHCNFCKKRLTEQYWESDSFKEKVCRNCQYKDKYSAVSYNFIKTKFGRITESLNLKLYNGVSPKIYTNMAKAYKKIIKYRESQKKYLLALLTDDPIFRKLRDTVQDLNVKDFEKLSRTPRRKFKVDFHHPETLNKDLKQVYNFICGKLKIISLEKLRKKILISKFYYF